MITYKTGRTYDKAQELKIEVLIHETDEFGINEITVHFVDESRHINGTAMILVMGPVTDDKIGRETLSAYDAGHYN